MSEREVYIAEKKWEWAKRTLTLLFGVAVAVLIALYIQRDSLLGGCIRGGPRAALSAQFALDAAGQRETDAMGFSEDSKEYKKLMAKAAQYKATAQGQIDTIAAPEGMQGDPDLAEMEINIAPPPKYVLTKKAAELQEKGCRQAFPAPLGFIE